MFRAALFLLPFLFVSAVAELSGPAVEVFIVPHSHEDTGWGDTADALYIKKAQWILSTVVPALESPGAAAAAGAARAAFSPSQTRRPGAAC